MTTERLVLMFAAAGMLAACQQVPTAPPPEPPPKPAVVPPAPPPPVIPEPPSRPAPAGLAAQQQAQKIAKETVALLEMGKEDQARSDLQRALAIDPNNALALNLMRQITAADPVAVLGQESYPYVVRQSETLSAIAGRVLNDIYAFYILARYNGIAVPKQIASGQTLRLPGKAPSVSPRLPPALPPPDHPDRDRKVVAPFATIDTVTTVPESKPVGVIAPPAQPSAAQVAFNAGEAAERRGELDRALTQYSIAVTQQHPGAQAKVQQVSKELARRRAIEARKAMANQDLDGAIQAWDRVLVLDPSDDTAALERKRAMALRKRLEDLPTAEKAKKP